MTYELGDIIQLNSGGPEMTVVALDSYSSMVKCSWFEGAVLKKTWFPLSTVREYAQFVEGVY